MIMCVQNFNDIMDILKYIEEYPIDDEDFAYFLDHVEGKIRKKRREILKYHKNERDYDRANPDWREQYEIPGDI